MRRSSLIALTLLSACGRSREPAPEDLDGLTRFLYRTFQDPQSLAEGVANLAGWLDRDGDSVEARRGYTLTNLEERDVASVPHPDAPLDRMIGAAATYSSAWPLIDHTEVNLERDQTWQDPSTYVRYVRAIDEGDPRAFVQGEGTIGTLNDIERLGAFNVSIPFASQKNFAWVALEGGDVLVARGGLLDEACSSNGRNCLHQSFTLEVWYGRGQGDTTRLTASWNHVSTEIDAFLSEDQRIAFAVDGIIETFLNTDAYLDER